MPRNQHVFKVVDGDNEEGRGKSRGLTLNRVTLVGRLAGDPKLHYTPRGSPVAQLRLATNEGEEPECHALSAWGKLAEFAGSYLKKAPVRHSRPVALCPRDHSFRGPNRADSHSWAASWLRYADHPLVFLALDRRG